MDEKVELNLTSVDIEKRAKKPQKWKIWLGVGVFFFVAGAVCLVVAFFGISKTQLDYDFPKIPSKETKNETYSALTGELLTDSGTINAPTYCIQTPNGMDGARPQAGLTQAGVIFEAIAEAGITRFAAIYQNPTSAVIGPIRSLRLYYLEWDTPFDCTIVHAGGADDALEAVRSGGYKDLTENYTYMYRGKYSYRAWNNLFTTAELLKQFSNDRGYTESKVNGFSRMTPEAAKEDLVNTLVDEKLVITEAASKDTSVLTPKVGKITLNLGGLKNFNVVYNYDVASNKYLRSYASGTKHEVYRCPTENLGKVNPEDYCELTQMAPTVVVAMVVEEKKASDNYHESIKTIGSNKVYVFQNGNVTRGTWQKDSASDQLKFIDENGNEIQLVPGQTILTAVPTYGSVDF